MSKLKTFFKVATVGTLLVAALHAGNKFDPINKVSSMFNGNSKKTVQTYKKRVVKALTAAQMQEANMLFESQIRRIATADPKKLSRDIRVLQPEVRELFGYKKELSNVRYGIAEKEKIDNRGSSSNKELKKLRDRERGIAISISEMEQSLVKRGLPSGEMLYRQMHGSVYQISSESLVKDPYLKAVERRAREIADEPANRFEQRLHKQAENIVDRGEKIQEMIADRDGMDKKSIPVSSFWRSDLDDYNELVNDINQELKQYRSQLKGFGQKLKASGATPRP